MDSYKKIIIDVREKALSNGIDLYALPTCMNAGRVCIDWINSAGYSVTVDKDYKGRHIDLTVVIERYDKKTRKITFVGYEKGIDVSSLIKGYIGTIFTSIVVTHPHTIPYFLNPEDAYKYTAGSNKKVLFICPICAQTHEMIIKNFINNGFICPNENCQNSLNFKLSEARIGKYAGVNNPMYGRTGENHPMYGKKHSEETKQKLSEARIGKYAGVNSPNWQGGITPIKDHLRTIIEPFMEAHRRSLNYTCELTGKFFYQNPSHHIYPFTNIVHDAHDKNNITIKPNVGDYTPEELKVLEDYVLSWHVIGDYSNMILLAKDVHKQVHNSEFYKNTKNKHDPNLTYEAAHKFMEEFKLTWSNTTA